MHTQPGHSHTSHLKRVMRVLVAMTEDDSIPVKDRLKAIAQLVDIKRELKRGKYTKDNGTLPVLGTRGYSD